MKIETVKISFLRKNPDNPRTINKEKYDKLVNSIKEFPEMLNIRPIVVDNDMMVLGGNMRLKACKEAGLKEIPIIKADNLTKKQQKEFIIKDNVGFGEWDWDLLSDKWDKEDLNSWGIDVPIFKELMKSNEVEIQEYNKVHILLSFHPNKFAEIENILKEIKKNEYIEYEQSAN